MGIFNIFGSKTITPAERRNRTIERLKKEGIAVNEQLPLLPSSEEVSFKSEDEIMNRMIAAYTAIQVACDIANGKDHKQSVDYMINFMAKCKGDKSYLLEKENKILEGKCSKQDIIDVVWTYEAVFTLMWAVGYKADKYEYDVSEKCSGDAVTYDMVLISNGSNTKPNLKKEKVLDALDLFRCYWWACAEKAKKPETSIGNINREVVAERLRALEWLIGDEKDWFNIKLSA